MFFLKNESRKTLKLLFFSQLTSHLALTSWTFFLFIYRNSLRWRGLEMADSNWLKEDKRVFEERKRNWFHAITLIYLRHLFIQSEVKLNPIATPLHMFSRALRQLHVFTVFLVIG